MSANTYAEPKTAKERLKALGYSEATINTKIGGMTKQQLDWYKTQKDFTAIDTGSNSANRSVIDRIIDKARNDESYGYSIAWDEENKKLTGGFTSQQMDSWVAAVQEDLRLSSEQSYSGISATLQEQTTFKESVEKIATSVNKGQLPSSSELLNIISTVRGDDTTVEGTKDAIATFNGLFKNGTLDTYELAKLNADRGKDNIDLIDRGIQQQYDEVINRYLGSSDHSGITDADYEKALQQVAVLKQIRTLLDGQITNTIATGMKNVQTYTQNAIAVGKDIDTNKQISYENITKLKEAGLIDSAFKYVGEEQQGDNGETRTVKFTYDTNELMSAQLEKIRTARDEVSEELYEAQEDFLKKREQYQEGKNGSKAQELKQALSDAETKMFELAGIMQDYTAQEIKIIKNNEGARGVTAFNSYTSAIDSVASGFLSNGQIDIDNWMKLDSQTQATMFKRRNTTATAWEINSEGKQIGTPNQPYQFSGYEIDYDAIFASKTLALSQALGMCSSTINKFTEQYEKATGKQKDTIAAQIKAYKIMQQSLKDTYSTLDKFKAAQGTANKGDNFRSSKSALDTMKQAINSGRYNTDDFYGAYEYYYGQEAANALREGTINKSDIKKKYYQTKTRFYDSTGNLNVNKSLEYLAGAGVIKKQGNKYIPDASLSVQQMVEKSGYDAGFLKDLFGAMSQYALNNDQRAFADSMYQQFRDYMINDLKMDPKDVDNNALLDQKLETVNLSAGTVNISANKIEEEKKYTDKNGNIITESSAIKDGLVTKTEDNKYKVEGFENTSALSIEAALSLLGYSPVETTTTTTQQTETESSTGGEKPQGDKDSDSDEDGDKEFKAVAVPDWSQVDSGIASRNPTTIQTTTEFDGTSINEGIADCNGAVVQTVATANVNPIKQQSINCRELTSKSTLYQEVLLDQLVRGMVVLHKPLLLMVVFITDVLLQGIHLLMVWTLRLMAMPWLVNLAQRLLWTERVEAGGLHRLLSLQS